MKTTLIFATLILFAAFMGCSDSQNVLGPQSEFNTSMGQQKAPGSESNIELVWTQDELSVKASNGDMEENKCAYTNLPLTEIASYKVQFDVQTDANKLTNGYIPVVAVYSDEDAVFQSSAFPNENGEALSHVGFRLTNVRFNQLKFYIALMQGDGTPANQDIFDLTTLSISKIAVYRVN